MGTRLIATGALAALATATPALAQPGMQDPASAEQQPPPPPEQPQPGGPVARGATQATFVSTTSEPWDVLVDHQPACMTPCSLSVDPVNFLTFRSQDGQRVLLDVGSLPPGNFVVRGTPLQGGKYAGGIVATTFAGMGLVTGITLTAVGYGADIGGMKTAGLITGGVSAVGLYLGIKLMRSAVPRLEVLPAQPYVAGNTVGLAGSF